MGSGIKFEINSDTDELAKLIGDIARKSMPAEAAKALNRTVTFIKNEVAGDVSQRTGISKALLKRRIKPIKKERASAKRLRVRGFVGEESIPVSRLSPKPRKSGSGATYKTVAGQPIDSRAFIATVKAGRFSDTAKNTQEVKTKKTAWVRKNKRRGSMREVQIQIGPRLRRATRMIMRGSAQAFFEKTFFENMEKRINKDVAKRGLNRK